MVRGHTITLRSQVRGPYLRDGVLDRPLVLVVVKSATWQRGKGRPTCGRCKPTSNPVTAAATATGQALPLTVTHILAWVWQRWKLEVAHCEMKAGVGVGQNQCWHQQSAVVSAQWSIWVSAVLVTSYHTWS